MAGKMLINVAEGDECRIAVLEDSALEEFYIERASMASHVGNIYKGKVVNIEPGIQAAFVDFGIARNGFLHISDLHPKYFSTAKDKAAEHIGRRTSLKARPRIQDCLKKGQELTVQVTKEELKTKGPTLSTYITLPGKYLVMMPWMYRLGVSQKVEDSEERKRLRQLLQQLGLPKGFGFIIRTAAQGCSKKDMQNDLAYLKRLWAAIGKRMKNETAPVELYQESSLVIRTLRDVFDSKIGEIVCDSESVTRKIRDFLSIAMPRLKNRITYYDGPTPLFHKYRIEDKISEIQSKRVPLKGGASIVVEQTEALLAIDVNSGKYRKHETAEQTAYRVNMQAAQEIPRQLRLRDLGGLIICDFIDMRNEKHRKDIERAFREAIKADRARTKILRMSRFGLLQMTRQRMRPSLQSSTYLECSHCGGTGLVKSYESLSIEIIRLLNLSASQGEVKRIEVFVSPEVASSLQNKKRSVIARIEQLSDKRIFIIPEPNCAAENYRMVCYDERGSVMRL